MREAPPRASESASTSTDDPNPLPDLGLDPHAPRSSEFERFLERVRSMVSAVVTAPQSPHPAFERVRRLLCDGVGTMEDENYCPPLGYDIGEAGVVALQRCALVDASTCCLLHDAHTSLHSC